MDGHSQQQRNIEKLVIKVEEYESLRFLERLSLIRAFSNGVHDKKKVKKKKEKPTTRCNITNDHLCSRDNET